MRSTGLPKASSSATRRCGARLDADLVLQALLVGGGPRHQVQQVMGMHHVRRVAVTRLVANVVATASCGERVRVGFDEREVAARQPVGELAGAGDRARAARRRVRARAASPATPAASSSSADPAGSSGMSATPRSRSPPSVRARSSRSRSIERRWKASAMGWPTSYSSRFSICDRRGTPA